mmetsp:Transcript_1297/g.3722  ORF Transcript_1297/g.3722 Transcript_1297/m.3722 type:complete len:252 (+) Transcript_1297:220-975(+)
MSRSYRSRASASALRYGDLAASSDAFHRAPSILEISTLCFSGCRARRPERFSFAKIKKAEGPRFGAFGSFFWWWWLCCCCLVRPSRGTVMGPRKVRISSAYRALSRSDLDFQTSLSDAAIAFHVSPRARITSFAAADDPISTFFFDQFSLTNVTYGLIGRFGASGFRFTERLCWGCCWGCCCRCWGCCQGFCCWGGCCRQGACDCCGENCCEEGKSGGTAGASADASPWCAASSWCGAANDGAKENGASMV